MITIGQIILFWKNIFLGSRSSYSMIPKLSINYVPHPPVSNPNEGPGCVVYYCIVYTNIYLYSSRHIIHKYGEQPEPQKCDFWFLLKFHRGIVTCNGGSRNSKWTLNDFVFVVFKVKFKDFCLESNKIWVTRSICKCWKILPRHNYKDSFRFLLQLNWCI